MALQQRLNKFNQQQQKCLSTLTSITARAGTPKATQPQKDATASTSSSISARSPASAIKFSKDIERLQFINSIRKSPIGAQIKRVIDLLLEALKAAGEVWLLSSFDSQESTAFPNEKDPKLRIMVDDDLKLLFRGIELPQDMIHIDKDLQKNRMKPVTNTPRRRLMAQAYGVAPKQELKKKQRSFSKRAKLTNAHLPELFQDLRDLNQARFQKTIS